MATDYNTKVAQIGGVTITVSRKDGDGGTAGDRLKAFLEWLSGKMPVDPGFGVDGNEKPDQGLPGGGEKPDQGLPPSGGRPDNTLPGSGGRPSHPIAPGGGGHHPDQGLPGDFLREHADEIAKAILGKCFDCHGGKPQPK